jgi:hypothetical protein
MFASRVPSGFVQLPLRSASVAPISFFNFKIEARVAVPPDVRVDTGAFRNSDLAEIGSVYDDRREKRELSLRVGRRLTAGRPSDKGSNAKREDSEDGEEHDGTEGEELFYSQSIPTLPLGRVGLHAWFLDA